MIVRKAVPEDLDRIVDLARAFKHELGFVRTVSLQEAMDRGTLLVVDDSCEYVHGFCEYRQRLDGMKSIYAILSTTPGGGRALLETVGKPLRLLCPEDLLANGFYEHMGLTRVGLREGKKRRLVEWQWSD